MSRAKIAPVLSALMDDLWSNAHGKRPHPKASAEGDRSVIRIAAAELRALLALARAAERHLDVEHYPWGASEAPSTDSLHRALARLERVSKGGR